MAPLYGTEQRIYGTLVIPCKFYLARFAIVFGDTTNDPDHTSATVIYGNQMPRRTCGHKYSGFMSLLYNAGGSYWEEYQTAGIVIEFRFCSKEKHKLVIETYGEQAIANSAAVWFLHTRIGDPDPSKREWIKVNSMAAPGILPYKKVSEQDEEWKFKEDMMNDRGSVVVFCCRKCPTCECIHCFPGVHNKFRVRTSRVRTGAKGDLCCNNLYNTTITEYSLSGGSTGVHHFAIVNKYGDDSMLFENLIIEITLHCGSVEYWIYYDKDQCLYNEWIIVEYLTDNVYGEDEDGNEVVTTPGQWIKLYEGWSEDI